jgi:hypothetical protein
MSLRTPEIVEIGLSQVSAREAVGRSVGQTIAFCGLPPCREIAGNPALARRCIGGRANIRVGGVGQGRKRAGVRPGVAD